MNEEHFREIKAIIMTCIKEAVAGEIDEAVSKAAKGIMYHKNMATLSETQAEVIILEAISALQQGVNADEDNADSGAEMILRLGYIKKID